MRKLIGFEFLKIITDKFFVISLSCLLVINIISCCIFAGKEYPDSFNDAICTLAYEYNSDPDKVSNEYDARKAFNDEQHNLMIEAFQNGDYSFEAQKLPNTYAPEGYTDEDIYLLLFEIVNQKSDYESKIEEIIKESEYLISSYAKKGISEEAFVYKYQEKIINTYDELPNKIDFSVNHTYGWDIFFDYSIVNVFIICSLIISTAVIFTYDNSIGFSSLLRTTSRGRLTNGVAKLITACILCILIITLFYVTSWICIGFCSGYSELNFPLQMLRGFEYSHYLITIKDYLVIFFVIKTITLLVFTTIVSSFAIITKNSLFSFLISILFYGFHLFLSNNTYHNSYDLLKNCNFVTMSEVNDFFSRYKAINIFGHLADYIPVMFLLLFITLLLFIFIDLSCYSLNLKGISFKKIKVLPIKNKVTKEYVNKYKLTAKGKPLSCTYFEMHKALFLTYFLVFLVLSFIAKLYITCNAEKKFSQNDSLYKEYINMFSGELTSEKEEQLFKLINDNDEILLQEREMREKYNLNEISSEEYTTYLSEYASALLKDTAYNELERRIIYIKNQRNKGYEAWLIYDTGWNALLLEEIDWIEYFLLVLLCSGVFSIEYKKRTSSGGFYQILRATKFGRKKTFVSKFISAGVIALFITILFNSIELINVMMVYDTPMSEAPIHSLFNFSNFKLNMSIGEYAVIFYITKIVSVLILSLTLCSFSLIFKNALFATFSIIVLTLLPNLISNFGLSFFDNVDYMNFMLASPLITKNEIALIYISISCIICVISLIKAKKIWC